MLPICRFHLLLECTHEPLYRLDVLCDLRVVDLEQQTKLSSYGILYFGNLVPWRANLDELLLLHLILDRCLLRLQLLRIY